MVCSVSLNKPNWSWLDFAALAKLALLRQSILLENMLVLLREMIDSGHLFEPITLALKGAGF